MTAFNTPLPAARSHRRFAARMAAAALACGASLAMAVPITYDFSWVGSGGYSMTGRFSFDSAVADDGAVRDAEVSNLAFEGFLDGVSIGSNTNAPQLEGFRFNFDAANGRFFLSGDPDEGMGQLWNADGEGLGFGAGSGNSAFFYQHTYMYMSTVFNPSPLVASLVSVPEPSPLALAFAAVVLAGLGQLPRLLRRPERGA